MLVLLIGVMSVICVRLGPLSYAAVLISVLPLCFSVWLDVKMPLSSKEKMRRYRERLKADPDKHAEYKARDRDRWHDRVEAGTTKTIAQLTKEEQKKQRAAWRKRKREQAIREKRNENALRAVETPPMSPNDEQNDEPVAPVPIAQIPLDGRAESNKKKGRKKLRHKERKCYKDLKETKRKLSVAERKSEKYRKQAARLRIQLKPPNPGTPNSKTDELLKNTKVPNNIRKKLVYHHTMVDNLKSYTQKLRRGKAMLFDRRVMRKYGTMKMLRQDFGDHWHKICPKSDMANWEPRNSVKYSVRKFFERDDVSRLCAGKKETVTRSKVKRQKRYLLDTIQNIHKKYLSLNPSKSVSYTWFCKMKPFHVIKPNINSRETCLCRTCDNVQLKLYRLKLEGVISTTSIHKLLEESCCDAENNGDEMTLRRECCYGTCKNCESKSFKGSFDEVNLDKEVTYSEWEPIVKTYMKGGVAKQSKATDRVEKKATLKSLIESVEDAMKSRVGKHLYRIAHQFLEVRKLKQKLQNGDALLHIDFAENWATKLSSEIMSKHFGASQTQITLHNGVAYLPNDEIITFSTLSDSLRHDAAAIWAYLDPVIQDLLRRNITRLYINSDGPTTQYRNRTNFYLIAEKMKQYGLNAIWWNFSESGHGKGAADGVGAALKRAADQFVANGNDLPDGKSVFEALRGTSSIHLYYVNGDQIVDIDDELPLKIPGIPGTMHLHQIIATKNERGIRYRNLSCFCKLPDICECYDIKSTSYSNNDRLTMNHRT